MDDRLTQEIKIIWSAVMKLTKSKLREMIREELKESSDRDYKKVRKILDQVKDGLSTLIKYGEDYSVFQDAKYASKTLKKVWRDIARIT